MNDMKYPHIVHIEQGITEDIISKVSYAVGTQVIDLEGRLGSFVLQCQLCICCLFCVVFAWNNIHDSYSLREWCWWFLWYFLLLVASLLSI